MIVPMASAAIATAAPLTVGAAQRRRDGPANRGCVAFECDRRHYGVFGMDLSSLAYIDGFLTQDLLVELT